MGNSFQFIDIIFFAMVAGFIFLRLRSVLGRRTGHERPPSDYGGGTQQSGADDNVIPMPDNGRNRTRPNDSEEAKLWADDSPVGAGLTQIKIADHSFEPSVFLEGARGAYEMIVTAFAEGDRDTLRGLLGADVYENFDQAIAARESQGHLMETRIVSIDEAEIVDARMNDRDAEVTVRFVSQMITALRDQDEEMVEGHDSSQREVIDLWTFSRNTASADPNWELSETGSEE